MMAKVFPWDMTAQHESGEDNILVKCGLVGFSFFFFSPARFASFPTGCEIV